MEGTNKQFNMLTFNMHGFNQGAEFLTDACTSLEYDVIFLQEHWLSEANMSKLHTFNNNYLMFGISAMSVATATGILIGRPYGGGSNFS